MSNENHDQLNDLLALLSPAAPNNPDAVQKEPLTYHRRGHWFEPSIAHHLQKVKLSGRPSPWSTDDEIQIPLQSSASTVLSCSGRSPAISSLPDIGQSGFSHLSSVVK